MTDVLEVEADTIDIVEEDARDRSLQDDLRALGSQARDYAQAEFSFQKTRLAYAGKEARGIAVLLAGAVFFVMLALMGLVFGLVLALTPLITAWGATAAVCLTLLVVAVVCGILALGRWRGMTAALGGEAAE
jgi:Flp pilus assembly protein TadB